MDCIFCKIVNGKIPSRKITETEKSLAFLDIFPLTKGHTLVIPKKHYIKIQEMSKEDNSDLFEIVRILTGKMELLAPYSLVAIHNGKESGQEIPHVHVHIIPQNTEDSVGPVHNMFSKKSKPSNDEFDNIVDKLTK